ASFRRFDFQLQNGRILLSWNEVESHNMVEAEVFLASCDYCVGVWRHVACVVLLHVVALSCVEKIRSEEAGAISERLQLIEEVLLVVIASTVEFRRRGGAPQGCFEFLLES